MPRRAKSCGARSRSPVRESPEATPGGICPWSYAGGGDAWNAGSYDPHLRLIFWSTAQAKPWVAVSRGLTVEDAALYTNSTLALNPDDGAIVWYRQHVPGETLDLDEAFEQVLIDHDGQRLLFAIGKHGILWKLDRENGRFVDLKETRLPERLRLRRPANRASPLPRRHRGGGDR